MSVRRHFPRPIRSHQESTTAIHSTQACKLPLINAQLTLSDGLWVEEARGERAQAAPVAGGELFTEVQGLHVLPLPSVADE